MATASPPPRSNLAAAHDGVRSNLPSQPRLRQALPLLPHQIINCPNATAFNIDRANLLSLLPSASGGGDILHLPPLPLLPHQISDLGISAASPFYFDDLFRPHAAMLLRGEITRRLDLDADAAETAVVLAVPVPDGAYSVSAPEIDTSDYEFSLRPPEDGLPEEVIARFLETAACEKAAAADGGDREPCAVCLDDLQQEGRTVEVLRCRHGFHGDCIGKWLRKKNTCPLCRAAVVDIL